MTAPSVPADPEVLWLDVLRVRAVGDPSAVRTAEQRLADLLGMAVPAGETLARCDAQDCPQPFVPESQVRADCWDHGTVCAGCWDRGCRLPCNRDCDL